MAAGQWWLCPNEPRCGHGAVLHDVEDLDDLVPRCCVDGCRCGARLEECTPGVQYGGMSTDAAAGHTPFTSVTWADLPIGLDPAHAPTGWEARVDLAYELAPHLPHLPIAQVRLLVESAASGLPVVLTWDTYLNRDLKSIERTRTTVVVAALYGPRGAHYVGEARIRYSGFGHSVQFRQIVSVDEVECTRTYRDLPLPEAQ